MNVLKATGTHTYFRTVTFIASISHLSEKVKVKMHLKVLMLCVIVSVCTHCFGALQVPAKAGDVRDTGSIPGSGRSPGRGHGNPLQYSCQENPHGQRSLAGYSSWGCRVRHD